MELIFNTGQKCSDKATIAEVRSLGNKNIRFGQIVNVFDGSYNFDATTQEERYGVDPLFKNHNAVVLKTNCDKYMLSNCGHKMYVIKCDLLLAFPNGEQVYCNSAMVEVLSNVLAAEASHTSEGE